MAGLANRFVYELLSRPTLLACFCQLHIDPENDAYDKLAFAFSEICALLRRSRVFKSQMAADSALLNVNWLL